MINTIFFVLFNIRSKLCQEKVFKTNCYYSVISKKAPNIDGFQ
jgi:hypothetical protein